ncbi:SMI1/KNR4 family protein [Bacillus sp. ISL-41]|uniref:SMI1/KNR4 family protein n=1 Tax=Bacillus sp. ISL-41 TaxID=2819127 RepID=UPI001BE622D4|nr:SMI1/KNR4 family protein [Bacillus sp. ISL-41]
MDFNEFLLIVEKIKANNPIWFELETAPIGTDSEIAKSEKQLSVSLPKEYKLFIKKFGGGYFAFTNIFSVSDSEWNIIQQNNEINLINSHKFIAVSDNEIGDYYGFEIKSGICSPKVKFYNHEINQVEETEYDDLYQYLFNVGLKQG